MTVLTTDVLTALYSCYCFNVGLLSLVKTGKPQVIGFWALWILLFGWLPVALSLTWGEWLLNCCRGWKAAAGSCWFVLLLAAVNYCLQFASNSYFCVGNSCSYWLLLQLLENPPDLEPRFATTSSWLLVSVEFSLDSLHPVALSCPYHTSHEP
jgi:hypothetical protein